MTELNRNLHYSEYIQETILQIQALVEEVTLTSNLEKGNGVFLSKQQGPIKTQLNHDGLLNLKIKIHELHVLDIALVLDALPPNMRLAVWNCINPEFEGKVLSKVSTEVCKELIATTNHEKLCFATKHVNTNEIADVAPYLPQAVMRDIFKSLSIEKREQLRSAMSYSQDMVGSLMDFNLVTIRKESTIEAVLRYLRRQNSLPDFTDQLFVVDRDEMFIGTLPLNKLLINEPEAKVAELMNTDGFFLRPDDTLEQFTRTFNRYVFVSVPVIDEDGKLLGRVTANVMINFINHKSEKVLCDLSGLLDREDIFASVWKSAKNRWLWLSLNLCIAFFASRVIGNFEDTVEGLVALASLIPVVAIIASNSANQTAAIINRFLSTGIFNKVNIRRLVIKEFAISLLNGVAWGGIALVFVYMAYKNLPLGIVLFAAMFLNQLLGTMASFLIPLALHRAGRDTVSFVSNILLTGITTGGGLFIFLGLAAIFLTK